MTWWSVLLAVALLVIAAVFNAVETVLTRISDSKADALADDGVAGGDDLVIVLEDRERGIVATKLVGTSATVVAVGMLAAGAAQVWNVGGVVATVAVCVVLVVVIGTLAPKVTAVRSVERLAGPSARIVRRLLGFAPFGALVSLARLVARPFVIGAEQRAREVPSEEELVALADAAVEADVLDDSEGEMIQSLVDFGDTLVREAMVPRPDVLAVGVDTTIEDAIDALVERGVSRMPTFGDDIDDIRGIVHIKDLFARVRRGRGDHFVSIAHRTPFFVPETKRAAELLGELKSAPHSMVVVVDEYGGTAGIVTLEDLIEEILGEIVDEFDLDEAPLLEPLQPGEWRVHGRIPVDEFNQLTGAALPDEDWDTLGGLIFDSLGAIPRVGETVAVGGFAFTVEEVDGRRITRVLVVAGAERVEDVGVGR